MDGNSRMLVNIMGHSQEDKRASCMRWIRINTMTEVVNCPSVVTSSTACFMLELGSWLNQ